MLALPPNRLYLAMFGCTKDRADTWAPSLEKAAQTYGIDSAVRMADWLAQIGHESGGLRWVLELWGPSQVPAQRTYERDFAQPWGPQLQRGDRNYKAYGLGNLTQGDGFRFRGRSPMQITGRANYVALRDRLRALLGAAAVPDFEVDPVALEAPQWGALAAADFWDSRGLNAYADAERFYRETVLVNGGQNGWDDRLKRRGVARAALGLTDNHFVWS